MTARPAYTPPRNSVKATALIALVAALAGGTGGVVITPRADSTALVTKEDLRQILAPVNAKLEKIESALTGLHAEAAVARYEREHRASQ